MSMRDQGRGDGPAEGPEVLHAAMRGVVAAMAMTGLRSFAKGAGLVATTPPEEIADDEASALVDRLPRERRDAATEVLHWAYGATGAVAFALLPAALRRRPWAGPLYGVGLWVLLESVIAPVLRLWPHRRRTATERVVFLADHVLYGLVLSEFRRRPRE